MELTLNSAMEIAVQTLVGLYAAMPMKVVMLALALLCCLAGYRLLRLVSACIGVFAGVMLGVCVTSLFSASLDGILGLGLTVLAMVVLGGAGGVLFFYRRACGVFVLCAGIGAAVVYLPALFAPAAAQAAIVAAGALLFGVTGVLLVRPAGILTTALLGLFAAYALFDLLGQAQGAGTAVLGVLLVVAGCAVQALPRRKTGKSGAADAVDAMDMADAVAAERRDGGDAHLRAEVPEADGVSEDTHGFDPVQLPEEEPDEIDSISEVVAAHIGLTEPLTPEQAAQTELLGAPAPDGWPQFGDTPPADSEPEHETTLRISVGELMAEQKKETEAREAAARAAEQDETLSDTADLNRALDRAIGEMPNERPVWEQIFPPVSPDEAAEDAADTPSDDPVDDPSWDTLFAPAEEKTEPLTESAPQEEAPAQPDEPAEDAPAQPEAPAEEKTEPLTESAPQKEAGAQADEPAEPAPARKPARRTLRPSAPLPLLLTAVVLALAGIGIRYAEIALALYFACYVLRYYRTAAFACAVLCVRRVIDAVQLGMQGGPWPDFALDALSAVAFFALTYAAMHTYMLRRSEEDDEEEA